MPAPVLDSRVAARVLLGLQGRVGVTDFALGALAVGGLAYLVGYAVGRLRHYDEIGRLEVELSRQRRLVGKLQAVTAQAAEAAELMRDIVTGRPN